MIATRVVHNAADCASVLSLVYTELPASSHLVAFLTIHMLWQGDYSQGSKGESGSFDDPHEDMNLGQFNDLVHSSEQRQQLSMYNKRHKS